MKKQSYIYIGLFSISLFMLTACQLKVPIKEMVKAKKAISRAEEVRADKYDSDNLIKAIGTLYKSHEDLEEKDDKKAKKDAEEAYEFAMKAIERSLPLLAGDTLTQAEDKYKEAEGLWAEKFASEEFTAAGENIKKSEGLNNEKKYWDSYLKSAEAIKLLDTAIAEANEKISSLKDEIDALNEKREELESVDGSEIAEEELTQAKTHLEEASTNIEDNNVKSAYTNTAKASENLRIAEMKIQNVSLRERIKTLRENIEKLKKDVAEELISEDIDNAISFLNEAELKLDQEKYDDAEEKVSMAEEAYINALGKAAKGIAEKKIKSIEKLLENIKENDKKNLFEKEIADASQIIAECKTLFQNESYKECLVKAGEAESILNSLTVAMEKEYGVSLGDDSSLRVYIVKLNVKNRDCLWKIAHKVYKDAKLWPLIYMANKDQIKDPDLIFPGQKFKIPPVLEKGEKDKDKETVEETEKAEETGKLEDEKSDEDNKTTEENKDVNATNETESKNTDSKADEDNVEEDFGD